MYLLKRIARFLIIKINKIVYLGKKNFFMPLKRKIIYLVTMLYPKLQPYFCHPYIEPNPNIKHLFLDISTIVRNDLKTGVQRVVRSLLSELMQHPIEGYIVKPVYCTETDTGFYYAHYYIDKNLRLKNNLEDTQIDIRPNDIFLGLDFNLAMLPKQLEELNRIKQQGVKIFFIVYDLLPALKPKMFKPIVKDLFTIWLEVILKFDGVICISKAVHDELKLWIKNNNFAIPKNLSFAWFHLGADIENSLPTRGLPDGSMELINFFKANKSFISVSTIEPRKGYAQLLAAFNLLWQQNVDVILIIVGKKGWLVDSLVKDIAQHPLLNHKLFWLRNVSDEYLTKLYAAATCLIAPSEGEGFGLSLIEAAKYNLPIIARKLPVFMEVAQDKAFYFTGLKAEDLAVAVNSWLQLYALNSHPSTSNMRWLTWKDSADKLKEALLID
ncbi:MAG: hypothetical protein A3F18_01905 [Legionellales bacterium RIFCSPHIGHO2_12_FULL_37_14]|nr:MAG: hypothetical protein A3F18_01905 [Legionellales bacterium RIFCSPHIGHO2_12_FULL_37_14]